MSVIIKDGDVLIKVGSGIAVDTDCCCDPPCNCTVLGPRTDCENCANTDYPTSLTTHLDFKFSISGVAVGTNGCTNYEYGPPWNFGAIYQGDGSCEPTTKATHTAFFNADFILSPCTSTLIRECIDLGCVVDPDFDLEYTMVEYNELILSVDLVSGSWVASAQLTSWVLAIYTEIGGVGGFDPCEATAYGTEPLENQAYIYSYRNKTWNFNRAFETRPGNRYDPLYCTAQCNSDVNLLKCQAAGWSITEQSTSQSPETTCGKALDFSGATVSVATV